MDALAHHSPLPGDLQSLLANCYLLNVQADVDDFLLTDREATRQLMGSTRRVPDEVLLVRQVEQSLDMTLFLDPQLLARLAGADPLENLSRDNLDDFCRVLEGVSHFVCVFWKASNEHSVTQLELEVQAEIDKYLSVRLLLEAQTESPLSTTVLLHKLFANVRYHERLTRHERARYEHANTVAGRFCRGLEQRHPGERLPASMLAELRAFYRMPQPEKFSHINAAEFA